ncbi:hypothetical protein [Glycomyces sp. MUSA5-2]|uniref:hypothetical protein n=1 Tax=Glycomyces sp. MUSA5-2 TaxID=2053002 RepID=UPI0030091FE6
MQRPDDLPEVSESVWLGDFVRGPMVFSVFQTLEDAEAGMYRIDCRCGSEPRPVGTLTADPFTAPVWDTAWAGDAWCAWIELHARDLIAPRPPTGT